MRMTWSLKMNFLQEHRYRMSAKLQWCFTIKVTSLLSFLILFRRQISLLLFSLNNTSNLCSRTIGQGSSSVVGRLLTSWSSSLDFSFFQKGEKRNRLHLLIRSLFWYSTHPLSQWIGSVFFSLNWQKWTSMSNHLASSISSILMNDWTTSKQISHNCQWF